MTIIDTNPDDFAGRPEEQAAEQEPQAKLERKHHRLPTREECIESVRRHAKYTLGRSLEQLSPENLLTAVSLAVRDVAIDRMIESERRFVKADAKRLYYLSMEFLVGRSLGNNLTNLGLDRIGDQVLAEFGYTLEQLRDLEVDAALGNGGLGRLAACFLDSLATLNMPGYGYGINYEYGLFKQVIEDGWQREHADNWRAHNSPWLIEGRGEEINVSLYGHLEQEDYRGDKRTVWKNTKTLVGLPHDMPIIGYGGHTVNYLRLYSAHTHIGFDIQRFNEGNYVKAVEDEIATERISKVLYPSDAAEAGRELRLIQEYFFVACAIRDIVRHYYLNHASFQDFPDKVAIQLNDTHPALAVAELMRVLLEERSMSWDNAWEITCATLGFTNHTLLPEALEKWPESLLYRVLPRHMDIIQQIENRFMGQIERKWPGDEARGARMSIFENASYGRAVRMANLAIVGSHAVNGVAELHTHLLKTQLVPDFFELWPEKFSSKTNGVTPRRWLLKSNPKLAELLTSTIGDEWIRDLNELRDIEKYANDASFQKRVMQIKAENKVRLAEVIRQTAGTVVDPSSLFDVQAKRIHEYKRQLLNAMRVMHDYFRLVRDRRDPGVPRTYVFAGKAAPGYWAAKQIIKLINELAMIINADERVRGRMMVVFIPDFRVSLAERIIPAADLSEQISTAGKEASGTGNMKFAMNGALTMATWDGANVEIAKEVGEENIYVFGLRAEKIKELRDSGSYNPWDYYNNSPALKRVVDTFMDDRFFSRTPGLFHWIYDALLNGGDPYCHLADFDAYIKAQESAAREYQQQDVWARKAILNIARMGKFSSDRTILEYARDIWGIEGVI